MTSLRKSLSCLLLGAAFAAAHAQDATTGSISGTITDSTGAIVKGAKVTITNTDRNHVERTLTTNGEGFYTATSLPLGHYAVVVSEQGFGPVTTKLILDVSDAKTVSSVLKPGGAGDSVTVNAEAIAVNLQDASQAGLINSTQLEELEMPTSNYASLITLQPGVAFSGATDMITLGPTGASGSSSTVAYSVNGARTTSNNWTIDGADNLDRGANLTLYVYISPRAISEFKTQRGTYSAAFGRNAAGQVDVVTKSGTNQIHGGAYEFWRNDYLDAPGYLNNYVGTKISKYRYNNYGFYLGGPVWIPKIYDGRNKTFWFVSENWLRQVLYSTTTTALVPTASERAGDFSHEWYLAKVNGANVWQNGPVNVCTAFTNNAATQANTCTATGTQVAQNSALAANYLKDLYSIIPVPNEQANVALGLDPHTINNNIPNRYNNLDTTVRIDQQFGQRVNAMYRYVHDTFPTFQGAGTFVTVPIPGVSGTYSNAPGTQQLGKVTWAVTPTTVVNVGYAYSTGSIYTRPQGGLLQGNSPDIKENLPFTNSTGVISTLAFNSYFSTLGGAAAYSDHGINHQVFGDITKVKGVHTLIFGFSYDHYEKQENNNGGGNQGTFNFTNDTGFASVTNPQLPTLASSTGVYQAQSFANFLTGNVNNGFTQVNRITAADVNENIYEGYFQDNWRALPRLTLNLGLRYTYLADPTDATGLMNNFDASTFSAAGVPTIASTGLTCFTATCSQAGSNAGLSTSPNLSADFAGLTYINGLVYTNPSAANNNQGSRFGNSTTSMQKTGFAPRLGFAFDLFGDGKTALRGGYGWAYDQIETSYWETTDWNNPPASVTYSATQAVLDSPAGGGTGTTSCPAGTTNATCTTPGRIQSTPLNQKLPYTQQYSLDLQQQLSQTLFVDMAYVGSHGNNLSGVEQINQPKPNAWRGVVDPINATGVAGSCRNGTTNVPMFYNSTCDRVLNQIKPYLGYFAIDAQRTIFSSNYNALQIKATKKYSGKTYIDANFTWSRTLTNSIADYSGFPEDIYNLQNEYGPATFSRKLLLTVDGVYELPWYRDQKGFIGHVIGGWELSGIYTAVSGLPLTISASGATTITQQNGFTSVPQANNVNQWVNDNTGLSLFGNTNAGIRVNQISDPNNGGTVRLHPNKKYLNSGNSWFNTSAFQVTDPTSTVTGTAHRGDIIGPGYNKFDFGLFRNFRLFDHTVLQMRWEAYNALNHTNIQTISTTSSSVNFGQVSGYRDPRIMQIAARLTF